MYIPPVRTLRTDPVSRARSAYVNISGRSGASPERVKPPKDKFSLSDEARLREEYVLRLMQDGRRAGIAHPAALPTLAEMARLYVTYWEEIKQTFREDPSRQTRHAQALDAAWKDTLRVWHSSRLSCWRAVRATRRRPMYRCCTS